MELRLCRSAAAQTVYATTALSVRGSGPPVPVCCSAAAHTVQAMMAPHVEGLDALGLRLLQTWEMLGFPLQFLDVS